MKRSANRVNVCLWNVDTGEVLDFSCCNRYYAAKKVDRLVREFGWISDEWDCILIDDILGTIVEEV